MSVTISRFVATFDFFPLFISHVDERVDLGFLGAHSIARVFFNSVWNDGLRNEE